MRPTSIYPGGPERSPGDPLADAAEVADARRLLARQVLAGAWRQHPLGQLAAQAREEAVEMAAAGERFAQLDLLGPEQFDSHVEYETARDRERWGEDPFGEE